MPLSARKVKTAPPGRHTDARGLILFVQESGSRSWVLRYQAQGRRRDMGLGSWPDAGLAMARERRDEARRLMAEGHDPIARKRQDRPVTFKDVALEHLEKMRPSWGDTTFRQWTSSLEKDVFPGIGAMHVARIGTDDVLSVLEPLWWEKPEAAKRLRRRIEAVIGRAGSRGLRDGDNPARWRGHLEHLLPKPGDVRPVRHHPALPHAEIAGFMALLSAREGVAARALAFTILTAARSGETRGMTWGEVDPGGRTWTIPAGRMKAKKEHRVPLSGAAIALLGPRGGGAALVFGSEARTGRPMSDMTMTAVLRRMKRADVTVHGFRSTFRDWAGETTEFPREVIEAALAHGIKDKAEAAYARSDLLEKRRGLMEAWAAFATARMAEGEAAGPAG